MILIRLVILAFSSLFFLAVTATALAGFLVITGKPMLCIDRTMTPAPEPNAALQSNWTDLVTRVGNGEAVAVSVTEEQASRLAQGHLDGKELPIRDLEVVFCPDGSTEALGKITFAGLSSDVLVKGRLDVDREHAQVQIESIKAGNLPSFVTQKVLDALWESEGARTLPVELNVVSMDVQSGEAIVVIAP